MSVFVFLGPTLPVNEARAILDAEYLPPVSQGDVYNVMQRNPTAIVIIDGYFDQVPSVWHKEILFALSSGVPVLGASSLGALRGAELHAFGMTGMGDIFEAYRDGEIEDDDEVAVVHGPAESGYACLSEAMVNLRDGLARACQAGAISAVTRTRLEAAAKARFYAHRSWEAVLADGVSLGAPIDELDALRDFVRRERPNLKRQDAIRLLRQLASEGIPARHLPAFDFHPTCNWVELTLRETRAGEATNLEALVHHVAVASGNASPVLKDALQLQLLAAESERLDLEVEQRALDDHRRRLLAEAPELSDDDREHLATVDAIAEELIARRLPELGPFVRLALARRGELPATIRSLERTSAGRDEDLGTVLEWYRQSSGVVESTPEAYAGRLGLPSARAFIDEVVALYQDRPC